MYTRPQDIEEEHLDWEKGAAPEPQNESTQPVSAERFQSTLHVKMTSFFDKTKNIITKKIDTTKLIHFINENTEISLVFAAVVLPYIVGFCFSYFLFYFYGGMSIGEFLGMDTNHLGFEAWTIGAYIFITILAVWAIFIP